MRLVSDLEYELSFLIYDFGTRIGRELNLTCLSGDAVSNTFCDKVAGVCDFGRLYFAFGVDLELDLQGARPSQSAAGNGLDARLDASPVTHYFREARIAQGVHESI